MKDPKGPVKPYKSPEELSKKHKVSLDKIMKQVKIGTKVEGEHTTDKESARITALQHVDELPDYYTRLKKVEKKPMKEESTAEKQYKEDTKYCLLCRKNESREECSWGPSMWDRYSIAKIHPANESLDHDKIEEGMTMKDFKQQRSRQNQKQKREDLKTSPNRRKDIHTDRLSPERAARHRANADPDFEGNDERNYPGGKLNPKKERKAKALGELGEGKSYDQFILEVAAWQRKAGKNSSGGLNEKGRKSYEKENPGSDLKAPSKKVGNSRRASFCARMSGMKKKLTSKKTANDPNSRINKSLRAWNC
jgi:hypothetical protein